MLRDLHVDGDAEGLVRGDDRPVGALRECANVQLRIALRAGSRGEQHEPRAARERNAARPWTAAVRRI